MSCMFLGQASITIFMYILANVIKTINKITEMIPANMSTSIDIVTQLLVFIGLIFTVRSIRQNSRIAKIKSYHDAIGFQKDTWLQFFLEDSKHGEEMLSWHLKQRGIERKNVLENKKILFILLRFDVYEEMILSKKNNILTENQIAGWKQAIKRDFGKEKEFYNVWQQVKQYYHPELDKHIEKLLKKRVR